MYLLISGSTSGMGQYMAIQLSKDYNLILNGRNDEKLSKTLELCSYEKKHLLWNFDLKNVDQLEADLTEFLQKNNITVTTFIHCAGFLKMLPLKNMQLITMQETMNVNFLSSALIIKTLINKKANDAALQNVVQISSTAGIRGAKAFNIYSASKGAMDAMTRSLAVELAPKVRINSVLPGGVQTQMTDTMFNDNDLIERMAKDYPLGLGFPNDVYEMVKFLISEKSKWITGQQFVVDGGRSINITA
jgi:NAD(P)-dependent dehydrogenase (short-subunit alcohol dehydrogenase family)